MNDKSNRPKSRASAIIILPKILKIEFRANCKTPVPRKIDDFGDNFQGQRSWPVHVDENIPGRVGEETR